MRRAVARARPALGRGGVRAPLVGARTLRPQVPLRRVRQAVDVGERARAEADGGAVRVHFTVGVYQKKGEQDEWTALVAAADGAYIAGTGEARLRERMIDRLRDTLRKARPVEQDLFQLPVGTELVRIAIDVKAKAGNIHGHLPLVVEPRWTGAERQHLFVYPPPRRDSWFITENRDDIPSLALALAREHFTDVEDEDDIEELFSEGKDRLVTIAFSAEPMSLLDMLPSRKKDNRAGAAAPRPDRVLYELAVDETHRASAGALRLGAPRSPYRERMSYLLGGAKPRSVAVVGPPGAGKTMIVNQWI